MGHNQTKIEPPTAIEKASEHSEAINFFYGYCTAAKLYLIRDLLQAIRTAIQNSHTTSNEHVTIYKTCLFSQQTCTTTRCYYFIAVNKKSIQSPYDIFFDYNEEDEELDQFFDRTDLFTQIIHRDKKGIATWEKIKFLLDNEDSVNELRHKWLISEGSINSFFNIKTPPPFYTTLGLPTGWGEAKDKHGVSYFIHYESQKTTYDDPRKSLVKDVDEDTIVELQDS